MPAEETETLKKLSPKIVTRDLKTIFVLYRVAKAVWICTL